MIIAITCTVLIISYFLKLELETVREVGIKKYAWGTNISVYLFMFSFLTFAMVAILGFVGNVAVPHKLEYGWTNNIVAFKDKHAYVVSRYDVEQSDRYYYLVKDNQNFIRSYWASQSNSRLIETNETPHVEVFVPVRDTSNFFYKDLNRILEFVDFDENNKPKRFDFYIPEGSVTQDFGVDLK